MKTLSPSSLKTSKTLGIENPAYWVLEECEEGAAQSYEALIGRGELRAWVDNFPLLESQEKKRQIIC